MPKRTQLPRKPLLHAAKLEKPRHLIKQSPARTGQHSMVKCVTGTEAGMVEVTETGQMTETAETGRMADLTGQISHAYMSLSHCIIHDTKWVTRPQSHHTHAELVALSCEACRPQLCMCRRLWQHLSHICTACASLYTKCYIGTSLLTSLYTAALPMQHSPLHVQYDQDVNETSLLAGALHEMVTEAGSMTRGGAPLLSDPSAA